MKPNLSRRGVLQAVGLAGTFGLAGCFGSFVGEPAGEKTPPELDNTESPTTSEPERALLGYLDGIDRGDEEAAREHLHPDGPLGFGSISEPGVTIHELQQVSIEEAVERDDDLQSAEEARERAETIVAEQDADDWAIVYSSITSEENGDETEALLLIKEGDRWLIWEALDRV